MRTEPEWLKGLTHKDWLHNGSRCSAEQWGQLDWSKAFMDMGASPMGNLGPYWHVPDLDGDCVHRLYPKVLQSKWLLLIRRAISEARAFKR